jgi:hypothetical protein
MGVATRERPTLVTEGPQVEFPSFMKTAPGDFPPVSKWNLGGNGSAFSGEDGVGVAFWSYR